MENTKEYDYKKIAKEFRRNLDALIKIEPNEGNNLSEAKILLLLEAYINEIRQDFGKMIDLSERVDLNYEGGIQYYEKFIFADSYSHSHISRWRLDDDAVRNEFYVKIKKCEAPSL